MQSHAPSTASSRSPDEGGRAKSQPQRVYEGVSGRIQRGEMKPGDRVPSEPELMKEFGVSRTVVREAMSRLQASGQVQTLHGKGTFVLAPPAPQPLLAMASGDLKLRQVMAMLELRVTLEAEAASLAATRRTDEHLQAMKQALDAFDAHRRQGLSTVEDDFRFHAQIAAATGNEYFQEVLKILGGATIARRARQEPTDAATAAGPSFGEPQPSLEASKEITHSEHVAIYEAIRRGDAAAARAAMFMHLTNSRERKLRTLAAE